MNRPRLRNVPRGSLLSTEVTWEIQIRGQNCFLQTCHRKKTEQNTIVLSLWTPAFEGNRVFLVGFIFTPWAGVDGNAHYQAQKLQITILANPGIQTNFLPPRLVLS